MPSGIAIRNSKIVAIRDGIITDCTVLAGKMLCVPGQVVKKGQTLVSGYSMDGLLLKGTRSSGEIYANTVRTIQGVMPTGMAEKGAIINRTQTVFLIIGNKRIFLNNNSRISGAICDKMYEEYYITLPNGFRLPLGYGIERQNEYESITASSEQERGSQYH